jgi:hypothetical protein
MSDRYDTPQDKPDAPAVTYFDPYAQTMLFEDRRHFPASGREQFARWRDVESPRASHRGALPVRETHAPDGAKA